MIELLVASRNLGKLREIEAIFDKDCPEVRLYSLEDFNIGEDCPEKGDTFMENAIAKSLFYGQRASEVYTVGDDSGLAVEALNGAPGVYSSRYSGPGATDEKNLQKLLTEMQGIENRGAKFITMVCLSKEGKVRATFRGEAAGILLRQKQGNGGFGYDPIFYYPPLKKTFAQLSTAEKNRVSHRARAFQQLKDFLGQFPHRPAKSFL
jgi:XTP/dITP diphosphohydrolase